MCDVSHPVLPLTEFLHQPSPVEIGLGLPQLGRGQGTLTGSLLAMARQELLPQPLAGLVLNNLVAL